MTFTSLTLFFLLTHNLATKQNTLNKFYLNIFLTFFKRYDNKFVDYFFMNVGA